MSDTEKMTTPAPSSGPERSKRLRICTCVAGAGAAGIGLIYVLTGNARTIDIVLLVGGLLVAVVGPILMRVRNPGD